MTRIAIARRPDGCAPTRRPVSPREATAAIFLRRITRNPLKSYDCDKRIKEIQMSDRLWLRSPKQPGGTLGDSKFSRSVRG